MPMVKDLGLDLVDVGVFLGLGHLGAILASMSMIRFQMLFQDRTILLGSFLLGVMVGLWAYCVSGRSEFWILAFGSGFVITSMGIICNILVVSGSTKKNLGKILSGLHGMYGVGSFLGTFLVSDFLSRALPWWTAFLLAGALSLFMVVTTFTFFPNESRHTHERDRNAGRFRPAHLVVIAAFAVYVGAEISVSMWMSPFLIGFKGLDPDQAAYYASLYFLVMSGSRILCAFISSPRTESILAIGCLLISVAVFFYAYFVDFRFFPLTGLLGPFYPLLYSMMSRTFSFSWRILASLVNLGTHVFLGIINLSLGDIGKRFGVEIAYLSGPILTILAIVLLGFFLYKRRDYDEESLTPPINAL